VVGEIQKAYNVLAGILRRDADDSYDTAEKLKEGPLQLAKDFEWDSFTTHNSQMVDPRNPVRQVSHVKYPGKDHPAAIDVRSGMLERKSKYLKNYTPGWQADSVVWCIISLTKEQVYPLSDSSSRIQVGGQDCLSVSNDVALPA
jgi:hypothetical protein